MTQVTLRALLEALDRGEPVALATIVEVEGASPAPLGAKMVIWPDGRTAGTVGGGALEQQVVAEARVALAEGQSRLYHHALREAGTDAVGMLCGGDVRLFIEVQSPPPTLLLIGGGNVGQPLAEMARMVGFHVQIVDADPARGEVAALDDLPVGPATFAVIMTAEHNADEEALRRLVGRPAAYIGMIGSKRKVGILLEHLRAEGVSEDLLRRVHAPIGLDLGGRGPAEVALAVIAEILAVRYGGSARPLSELRRP